MKEKSYSLRTGYKFASLLVFVFVIFLGAYLLNQAIDEHTRDKLGRWCYKHCLLSGFMFLSSVFIFYGMIRFIFLKIRFLNGKIIVQKLSKSLTITTQMVEDMSIQKSGCRIYLKDGESIYIPNELNDFEEFKHKLEKFHNRPTALRPYLGTQQVFVDRKKKRK